MTKTFTNTARPRNPETARRGPGSYGYDRVSPYLFQWSRALQSVVSQAGSKLLSGKFHKSHCAIYKCEGGCRIEGKGDLVLGKTGCYFDSGMRDEAATKKMADLITAIVLKWNPMEPVDSMVAAASLFVGCEPRELRDAAEQSSNGGVFGGDALSSFFDWNPFSKAPIDRDYQRFCLTVFGGKTDEEVTQRWADEDLGESLLKRMQEKARERGNRYSYLIPMCCSPRRDGDKLAFWVNTGATTEIDGWKTQAELEKWIGSGKALERR